MDIIRIVMEGYGCEAARGVIHQSDYDKIKNSESLDDIWFKGLYDYLGREWKDIDEQFHDFGIVSGDIKITVNDFDVLDLPVNIIETLNYGNKSLVELEGYTFPDTTQVVVTSTQFQTGIICDVTLILDDEFNIKNFNFIKKEISGKNNEIIIDSLICEIYYEDYKIPFLNSDTDLRMSRVTFETNIKNNSKHGKN